MKMGNIFLILFVFVLGLFVSCKDSHKESESVVVEYASNSNYAGSISLNLLNGHDSFILKYDLFTEYCGIEVRLEGAEELLIKEIKFSEGEICILPDSDKTMYKLDKLWTMNVGVDLGRCIAEWKELSKDKQDLSFSIVTLKKEGGAEKNYSFRVSSENLLKFIGSVELVNPNGFTTNFS
nr:hypothetical protein LKV13_04925 [Borrelia sp. BU AG58]